MKKFNFALAAAIVGLAAFPMASQAADATGTATTLVVAPITISNDNGISFGTIAPTAASGTVVIAATAGGARTAPGGTVELLSSDVGGSAQFTVGGQGTSSFSTSIVDVSLTGPGTAMPVAFDHNAPTALTGGAATINVGGTLTVGANQTAGTYTGSVVVTVAYN